ncbi:probable disease resistance protein At4g27220 isoform X2 [Rosa chinensis]|nr:probable disease resistance protein At4g27220 isoform X2 [Rosa chinensis]
MALSTPTASATLHYAGPAPRWSHEVFLSFRGIDTRKGITSDIYDRLQNMRGIITFMDDQELEVGDVISPRLLTAIKESRFAIVVLSQHYASSSWCLEELTTIFQCMKDNNRILPLFYQVEPSHVRYQKGNFEVAFTKHESRQSIAKVKQWRDALQKVANLSGWDSKNYVSDKELVEDIVKLVWSRVLQARIENESTTRDFGSFKATRMAMGKVMTALKNDQVTVIGVHGMGGVGKTTMVKHVGAQARNNGLFDKVIMAVVSQSPDLKKIQAQLAEMLALKLEENTEEGRAYILKERIMRGNRILIILDDIWRKIELSSIGIPSNNELQMRNSKILLTTRIMHVCEDMDTQAKITLNILSEEDSLNLFLKKARMSFHESTEIYKVARKVVQKCGGLPIALIAVARALGDKDLEEWKEAAQRLQVSQPSNPEDERHVFECIKLSYDYLRSNDAKSCFLLCCLFPEDYEIPTEDLLKYGVGIGLFQDSNTMQEARARVELVVKSLKASSLLLEPKEKGCVRMHDVIRDVAISISLLEDGQRFFVKAGCELMEWPKINAHEGYSVISLMKNKISKLPEELVCPKLLILLLQHNATLNEIPKTFFKSLNELRVFDISESSMCSVPLSFCPLTNLHTLCLDGCKSIGDMSFLQSLNNLEILSMRECRPQEFPKEIGHLTNLRMLDITNLRLQVSTIPSKVISRLSKLEELYMHCDFGDWGSKAVEGVEEEANVGFDELTGLSDLTILKVLIYDAECLPRNVKSNPNWFKFDICIQRGPILNLKKLRNPSKLFYNPRDHYSRVLTLYSSVNYLPGWFLNVVATKTEKLQYIDCEELSQLTNIVMEHDHGKLHGLKYLIISGRHANLEELMNSTGRVSNKPVLEYLEELQLRSVDGLKQLCVGELPSRSLCNLKLLKVLGCQNLGNTLLPSKLLQRLQNLEKITCVEMNRVEYVFGSSSSDCIHPEHMTKLRMMRLWFLENLIWIWKGPAPSSTFHNLRTLVVADCMNLKCLFTSDIAQGLLQLEDLWVEDCQSLDSLIEPSEDTLKNNKMIIVFPKLKNLLLSGLPELIGFCHSGDATIHVECPSLEHLHLKECPQFSTCNFHSRNRFQVNNQQHDDILYDR